MWWKCELGHEWAVPIANRTRNPGHDPGCPYCHNRKVLPGFNDLATTHPEIAKEWNPYQNRGIKPTEVGAFSRKEVWWIAPCGHHFTLPVRNKAKAKPGYCCCCSGRKKPERPLKFHLRE